LQDELAAEESSAGDASPDADTAPDLEIGDGAESLTVALVEDAATAKQGGLKAAPRRGAVVRDPFDFARRELESGRPNRAIELLTEQLAKEVSPRGRFVRQTQLTWVMVEAGLYTVAKPILSRLVDTIDERKLEDWESGPLVAQVLALSIRVIDKTNGDGNDRARYYVRLCRLDPMQALALATP
jgi:type VI secretion system protein ImpA